MKIELKIEDDIVVDCKHKVFGCGSAIASSSYATEWIKNKKVEEVEKMTNKDIAKYLNLPPVKLHCSMLAEDAIKNAIQKYKIVQTKKKKSQEKSYLDRSP
jgi:nitrogen fixation NifU-like protein